MLRYQAASAAMIFLARDQCHSTHVLQLALLIKPTYISCAASQYQASRQGVRPRRDMSKYTERGSIQIPNKAVRGNSGRKKLLLLEQGRKELHRFVNASG